LNDLERKAQAFAAIGVMPKEANALHEPGRIREAFKAGHRSRDDEISELKEKVKWLTELLDKGETQ
jgi:hypothetical protein